MSNTDQIDQLSPVKRALLTIQELRARIEELERTRSEPIAVIGIGCRFPGGADDPASFWSLLRDGVDAIDEVPAERWNIEQYYDPDPAVPGKMATRWGGFIEHIDRFDAAFFGIAPREATGMDPQQRLLLEVSWEALEHAGLAPDRLAGSKAGVFVGVCTNDYAQMQMKSGDTSRIDTYTSTGNAFSVAAGRLSYLLGLNGPALAVDTACSSSLTAVHLACQSLRNNECRLALVGGVNTIVTPESTIAISQLRMLAADGRCKTFDAAADGYVRGEGCGVVVLKRLSDALADGDPILAVIRGSAVNQDGRSSSFTAPNGTAQEAVLREALANACVDATQVSYVEAHGTGTTLGDPIEVAALAQVLGTGRNAEQPLLLGSVKTNIGHLEAAAGIAGLIKVVLALHHGTIPPHLHLRQLNPHIDADAAPIHIPTAPTSWPSGERRIAGISSFGFSGTNVHVVLEAAPAVETVTPEAPERPQHLLTLSAKSEAALRALAERYVHALATNPSLSLADVCFTANTGRAHFLHRLALVADDLAGLQRDLAAYAAGELPLTASQGRIEPARRPKVAWLFTGQGSQYVGMGQALYDTQPVFRAALDQCAQLLHADLGLDLRALLFPTEDPDHAQRQLDQTQWTQPVLFAFEYALAQLWLSWGIRPGAVLGHSLGEYVAACVAGVVALADGLRLVAARGRLMQERTPAGAMVAVQADVATVEAALGPYAATVALAAINGPQDVVISGAPAEVAAVAEGLAAQGYRTRALAGAHAFHAPQLEPMLDAFEALVAQTPLHAPQIPLVSNLTGGLAGAEVTTAAYWRAQARQPVQFAAGLETLLAAGYTVLLEVGPQPVLVGLGQQAAGGEQAVWLPSLRKGHDAWTTLLRSLGTLVTRGVAVDWTAFDGPYPRRRVPLPTYPFQRQRFWAEVVEPDRAQSLASGPNVVSSYYDSLSSANRLDYSPQEAEVEGRYLTFGIFPEVVPGFSWTLLMAYPEHYPEHGEQALDAQKELRSLLFRRVDFAACSSVLDFGCGYASDLIGLAERYPHLQLDGYTIAQKQAEVGARKVRAHDLQERVRVYNRDSSRDEFPGHYDLVIGFEVAHHVPDKAGLFANIGRHLRDGGLLVLADFISNAGFSIDHQATSSFFMTKEQWIELLSSNYLRVVEGIDVSREIANFIYDPDFEQHLQRIEDFNHDTHIRESFQSYEGLGKLLRKGLASYTLFTIQKDIHLSQADLAQLNRQGLDRLISYAEAQANDWLYEIAWQSLEQAPRRLADPTGSWLILADRGGVGAALVDQLAAQGGTAQLIYADHPALPAPQGPALDPTQPEALRSWLEELPAQSWTGIVHLWSLDTPALSESDPAVIAAAQELGVISLLHLTQALAQETRTPRLWIVTQGSQTLGDRPEAGPETAQAPVWGFGRTLALEQPDLWGGLIDLDPQARPVEAATELIGALDTPGEQQAIRAGQTYVARLRRQSPSQTPGNLPIHAEGTYLITGGLGALGLQVAQALVARGARSLVLVGRRGADAATSAAIETLRAAGAEVQTHACDVADRAALAALLDEVAHTLPPLRGVFHAAGVLDDGIILQQNADRLARVLAPKVQGAWHLHTLTQQLPLDCFVLFSSAAAVLGSPGQASYAAANAFLDALAHHRQRQGLPGLSINWGPWAEGGMATMGESQQRRWAAQGMSLIAPEQGVRVLEHLLRQGSAQVAVLPIDWQQWSRVNPALGDLALLADLLRPAAVDQAQSNGQAGDFGFSRETLRVAEPAVRQRLLESYLAREVARSLQFASPADLDVQQPLYELGVDSLMAIELRSRIQSALRVVVPTEELIKGPSVVELAAQLLAQLSAEGVFAPIHASIGDQAEDTEWECIEL